MAIDVSDATFEAEVLARSETVPVVVDLWAEWCAPCRQLGPILERVVDEQEGRMVLAKVDTDRNPQVAASFQVQSIPAVYGMRDRKVVNGFLGARGEREVRAFVEGLLPSPAEEELASLVAAGDETSLRRALEIDPGHVAAVLALSDLLIGADRGEEALPLLERVPDSPEVRRRLAQVRHGRDLDDEAVEARLDELLGRVKADDEARCEFLDLLELLGADDPRTASWRRRLTAALY